MSTHTPGPWYLMPTAGHDMHGQSAIAQEATGNTVAVAYDGKADARLLAAAPELLEALRWFADELPSIIRTNCPLGVPMSVLKAHDIARAAIAKAEGGEA